MQILMLDGNEPNVLRQCKYLMLDGNEPNVLDNVNSNNRMH